jgi:DNA mismatch repair protein MutS2
VVHAAFRRSLSKDDSVASDVSRVLEFERVLDKLAAHCHFSVAGERAREIGPSSDADQVEFLLSITREAVDLLTEEPGFSVRGMRDIRDAVDRARIGLLLGPEDLRLTLDSVDALRSLRASFFRKPEVDDRFPGLTEFVGAIVDLAGLQADLARTVGTRGEILDSASEQLGVIRRELKTAHRRLIERLNRMLAESAGGGAIQDPIVTMREGRYVIPVRADRRGQVPGIVHSTSASGQTLFVEPMAAVELNNRWRELQMAEEHEIERILRERSSQIGGLAGELNQSLEAAAAVDLALAKARLAFELRATQPIVVCGTDRRGGPDQAIGLRQARHPLLDQSSVVPIDLHLGGD